MIEVRSCSHFIQHSVLEHRKLWHKVQGSPAIIHHDIPDSSRPRTPHELHDLPNATHADAIIPHAGQELREIHPHTDMVTIPVDTYHDVANKLHDDHLHDDDHPHPFLLTNLKYVHHTLHAQQ